MMYKLNGTCVMQNCLTLWVHPTHTGSKRTAHSAAHLVGRMCLLYRILDGDLHRGKKWRRRDSIDDLFFEISRFHLTANAPRSVGSLAMTLRS